METLLFSHLNTGGRHHKDRSQDELHLAVLTGRTKKIKHLLRKGVHIESVNSHGQTPLFCASFGGDNEVVSLLLRLGANPNRRCGVKGTTPVHGAAYRGSRRVLRLLVEAGGDLRLRDNEEQTPRDYALKQPSPIRRQKILHFLDLLLAMTLHRSLARPSSPATLPAGAATTLPHLNSFGTLSHAASKTSLALRRQGSLASVWGSCMTERENVSPRSPPYTPTPPSALHKPQVIVSPWNSRRSEMPETVSCHLLDQMYVSTSLPLLTPADLKRPEVTGIAYTCGGPTVYSPYTWLGTNVTVRRPTPALALPRHKAPKAGEDNSAPDQAACSSLLQELSVLRRLRHPAFLGVMAACHVTAPQPDYITLVFQQVPLGSLYHHLHVQHHDLSVGGAVEILTGVVEALLFLHAHSWLHCALSTHALHLVSTTQAKLGGFEFATEVHGKGCSMKAPGLVRASWLHPWQAPETLSEQMVSTRSEIYSLTTIIWEIWSGMPPWSGVEEGEVVKRVGAGEVLPPVAGEPPSLISYLTQYGLKWNAHERELDLSEIHTMLRSLRIQSNEEDRVPAVPAWGPPSIPNTPVIGRHSQPSPAQSQPCSRKLSTSSLSSQLEEQSGMKPAPVKPSRKVSKSSTMVVSGEVHHPGSHTVPEAKGVVEQAEKRMVPQTTTLGETAKILGGNIGGVDSGFSTPCTRTPSPNMDTITSAKINPSFLTSTPSRPLTTCVLRADLPPDLLPSKISMRALTSTHTPDILTREPGVGRRNHMAPFQPLMSPVVHATDSPTDNDDDDEYDEVDGDENKVRGRRGSSSSGYEYISNVAKRAFLTDGGEEDMKGLPERPLSACTNQLLEHEAIPPRTSEAARRTGVVRRGLSMTNIHSPSPAAFTCFTRTTSHVSLASVSSSSSGETRKPVRTVSQVTLTLKKLSPVSDSASSSSKDEVNDPIPEKLQQQLLQQQLLQQQQQQQQRSRRVRPVPKISTHIARSPRIRKEGCGGWEEITGIKPASHQVTRHSSSCSLASVPSSPTHHYHPPSPASSWLTTSPTRQHQPPPPPPPQTSLTLPHNASPSKQVKQDGLDGGGVVGRRWSSLAGTAAGLEEMAVRVATRRHSEGQRARHRRTRKRHEFEVEEEFFDDEFNASLFHQPHMQLSVGSSENLLDSRAPHSMLADGAASPASLVFSSFSPSLTTSEDEADEAQLKGDTVRVAGRARWGRLGAVKEDGSSEEEEEDDTENEQWGKEVKEVKDCSVKRCENDSQERKFASNQCKKDDEKEIETCSAEQLKDEKKDSEGGGGGGKFRARSESDGGSSEDSELGPWRLKDFGKEFEPLKSVQLLRNLEKSLSTYLPTHSLASDTEAGEL